jgi:DNA-binding XRE family transcriptional regulator
MLGLLQIYFANGLATRGKQLRDYEKEISSLEEENKGMKSEIASFGGLAKLTLIAKEKGYIKNPPLINLTTKMPVALNP